MYMYILINVLVCTYHSYNIGEYKKHRHCIFTVGLSSGSFLFSCDSSL